ncbi:carbohydrate kinase family protein [Microvirga pudoricolor]|uniref:carbohydrate kinase family protein n=1 Tax=Microvirga pudoricolor TaxID=2778729 RepID=UPI00194E50B1|nr:carbohydrate kinase [Microvirga pudoricolor]MBM6592891.1 carbohydrate kinase [Microvirga pudoricolor]
MLLSCGDALIDFMPAKAEDGRDAYVPAVGGSCLNVAVAMARLGAPTGLIGGISTDMFGAMIAEHAGSSGVSLRYVQRSPAETTLAFVRFVGGEPTYAFYDETTATRLWTYRPGTIPFGEIDAIHVGSTSLINDPVSAETLAMVEDARAQTTISFDPNCRPNLVRDKADYRRRIDAFVAAADIVRMSDVDFDFLYGGENYTDFAEAALAGGASLVVVTRGPKGVQAWCESGMVEVVPPPVTVADTIGAGDTFQGGLLVALREAGSIRREALGRLSRADLREALVFGTLCAGVTCSRPGADPPYRSELPRG